MNPQWKTVLATSNTIPRRSFDCSDKPILIISLIYLNFDFSYEPALLSCNSSDTSKVLEEFLMQMQYLMKNVRQTMDCKKKYLFEELIYFSILFSTNAV